MFGYFLSKAPTTSAHPAVVHATAEVVEHVQVDLAQLRGMGRHGAARAAFAVSLVEPPPACSRTARCSRRRHDPTMPEECRSRRNISYSVPAAAGSMAAATAADLAGIRADVGSAGAIRPVSPDAGPDETWDFCPGSWPARGHWYRRHDMGTHDAEAATAAGEAYRKLSRFPASRSLSRRVAGCPANATWRSAWASAGRPCARRWAASPSEGQLDRSSQRGWFVRSAGGRRAAEHAAELLRDGAGEGAGPAVRCCLQQKRPATFEEASRLRIAPAAGVVELRRLRSLDGVPVCVDTSVVVLAQLRGWPRPT